MNNRKQLLPEWIRFFCWISLVLLLSPISLIVGLFLGKMQYYLFGIEYYGSPVHPLPIFIVLIMTLHGIAAYGLLWGKRWGVSLGITCSIIGAILSVVGMISAFKAGQTHFELSIILQVLFLIALYNIREKWLLLDETNK
jgi:hypothetical protein